MSPDEYKIRDSSRDESISVFETSPLTPKFLASSRWQQLLEAEFQAFTVELAERRINRVTYVVAVFTSKAKLGHSRATVAASIVESFLAYGLRGVEVTECGDIGRGHRSRESRSQSHLDLIRDRAKFRNAGSKPSRTRLVSGDASREEIDRCEAASDGATPIKRGLESDEAYARRSERHEVERYRRSQFE